MQNILLAGRERLASQILNTPNVVVRRQRPANSLLLWKLNPVQGNPFVILNPFVICKSFFSCIGFSHKFSLSLLNNQQPVLFLAKWLSKEKERQPSWNINHLFSLMSEKYFITQQLGWMSSHYLNKSMVIS